MTKDELKNALLLAAVSEEVEEISSQDDIDMDKVSGIVLSDHNFISFHKDTLDEVKLDFKKGQIVLTYHRDVKDGDTWMRQNQHHVFPMSSVMKVLIRDTPVIRPFNNNPFNLKTTVINEKYYMSK